MDILDEAFNFAEMTLKINTTDEKANKTSSNGVIYALSVRNLK